MKVIDTNGITHIFVNDIKLTEEYIISPDIKEESEVAEIVHDKKLPTVINEIATTDLFDEGIYLNHYNTLLNKYGGRSFFNMTGFGDVSILATIHMLMDVFVIQKAERLFDPSEKILVFTNDKGLIKKINSEFKVMDVEVKSVSDIS